MPFCLVCQHALEPFLSFGRMPRADAFLDPSDLDHEFFFNLAAGRCEDCGMVQLCERVPDAYMFHDAYAYYSSISTRMKQHFATFAGDVRRRALGGSNPFVVEIGCNDGIMLEAFADAGLRHVGIDPSGNVLAEAARKGLTVRQASFNEQTASDIRADQGPADAIVAANVVCHIADIHTVFAGVRLLLKPSGLFVFEDPYIGAILEQTALDQFYDEHVFYFSCSSVSRLAAMHGLEVVDVQAQAVHGGELRYYIGHRGARPPATTVREWHDREAASGTVSADACRRFAARAAGIRDDLTSAVKRIVTDGHRVAGYGATSKSCTIINYCGLGPGEIEYIADVTPAKQGKVTPGAHIPVRPPEYFRAHRPDYAILFAWNHAAEIMEKESSFAAGGGRWITYVPEMAVGGAHPRRPA